MVLGQCVDHYKPNQVMASIAAAVPGILSLLENINNFPTPHASGDLEDALFFLDQLAKTRTSSLLLPLRINSAHSHIRNLASGLCQLCTLSEYSHNTGILDHLFIVPDITLVCYIVDILLFVPNGQM